MSWSASFKVIDQNVVDEQSTGVPSEPIPSSSPELEVRMAYEHCKQHALDMIVHGDLGGLSNKFSVYIGGHANPKHEKQPNWANDYITIRVQQD